MFLIFTVIGRKPMKEQPLACNPQPLGSNPIKKNFVTTRKASGHKCSFASYKQLCRTGNLPPSQFVINRAEVAMLVI